MKSFFDNLLDFLHSYVDIFVMGGIILIIALTINWRLNSLFARNEQAVYADNGKQEVEIHKPPTPPTDIIKPDDEDPIDEETDETEDKIETPETNSQPILVVIPSGSTSTKIGDILLSHGLVASSNEFVAKAVEMNLDRKLQSGNFQIASNSSLEDIVKIIAKQM